MIKVIFHGTRGSFPTHSPNHVKYGGHTSCISIATPSRWLILDAGTGMIDAGSISKTHDFQTCDILLSHLHLDHIVGIPSFTPLWDSDFYLNIYSPVHDTQDRIRTLMSPPYFPVQWDKTPAHKTFSVFNPGESLITKNTFEIDTLPLSHPGGNCGFRIHVDGYRICYITDTDLQQNMKDNIIQFVHDCDLLIFDSTYCDSEYGPVAHFGHSTWQMACDIAKSAKVKRLALFHHDPSHTDDLIDKIESQTKERFSRCFAARCGQVLTLPE